MLLVVAGLFVFETIYPRDVPAAERLIAARGYSDVTVDTTRQSCGRNRRLFRFRARRSDGTPVSGTLCFDLFRWWSDVRETG